MERSRLHERAGAVSGIYNTIATVVILVGILAMVAGFIQAIAADDDLFIGIMAGLLVALVVLVWTVVAWAGVQMFSLVAGYIHDRTRGGA